MSQSEVIIACIEVRLGWRARAEDAIRFSLDVEAIRAVPSIDTLSALTVAGSVFAILVAIGGVL